MCFNICGVNCSLFLFNFQVAFLESYLLYCSMASVRCNKKSGSEMNTWFVWQQLRTLITFYGVGGMPDVTENIGKTIS